MVEISKALLEIQNLHVQVEGERKRKFTVWIWPWDGAETHVLMGPNGTGKSTLGYAVTGNPALQGDRGLHHVSRRGASRSIRQRAGEERASSCPSRIPLEVPGVTLSFIRSALAQRTGSRLRLWDFMKKAERTMALLQMDASYAERDLNVGFSGGEKKKAEILQMLMLRTQARDPG